MKDAVFHLLCISLVLTLFLAAARGGSIRYELPELLGEHRYDGGIDSPFQGIAQVDTPFDFYSVEGARLVVEGSVSSGNAHGDGVIRQALEFDLNPFVSALPSFARSIEFSTGSVVGEFRIEEIYTYPFVPETTPLPNPDGYPPISFFVTFSVGPNFFSTNLPPPIEPRPDFLLETDGIVVDVPIVAKISAAYIVLQGPNIVPEPNGGILSFVAVLVFGMVGRSVRQSRPQGALRGTGLRRGTATR